MRQLVCFVVVGLLSINCFAQGGSAGSYSTPSPPGASSVNVPAYATSAYSGCGCANCDCASAVKAASGGSTGMVRSSGGSTGAVRSSSGGSTGSLRSSGGGNSVQSRATPLRAVAKSVTSPIARAGHWSYPGSIENHLAATHGMSSSGMSREQMLALHDSLHEGSRAPVSQSGCPGGVCPTGVTGGGLMGFGLFGRRR